QAMYGSYRRHSTAEFLTHAIHAQWDASWEEKLKALQRRRSSVAEILSSSSNRLLAAISASDVYEGYLTYEKWSMRRASAVYTKVGEQLRLVVPAPVQCSIACGGRLCKYENPLKWTEEEQAVKGLYSSWVTKNILAMARPSTEVIEQYNIIQQFKDLGICTIINLQHPREHASCGPPLEPESGFTYLPQDFMKNKIYFYNFTWKDYGVASLTAVLDMVKVMAFALQEGRVAVHCHAGLGRTGVLIACYLVFATRMSADQAILYMRAKRPNAIQTKGQLLCVREFAHFIQPLWTVFASCDTSAHTVTLSQYLIRQRYLLHGYEARKLKHTPKIVYLICQILTEFGENKKCKAKTLRNKYCIRALSKEISDTLSLLSETDVTRDLQSHGDDLMIAPLNAMTHDSLSRCDQKMPPSKWKIQKFPFQEPLNRKFSHSDSDLRRISLDFASGIGEVALVKDFQLLHQKPSQLRESSRMDTNCQLQILTGFQFNSTALKQNATSRQSRRQKAFQRSQTITEGDILEIEPSVGPRFGWASMSEQNAMAKSLNDSACKQSQSREAKVSCDPLCKSEMLQSLEAHMQSSSVMPTRESVTTSLTLEQLTKVRKTKHLEIASALAKKLDQKGETWQKILAWKQELNASEETWEHLEKEEELEVLSGLLWAWIEHLKEPILSEADLINLSQSGKSLDWLKKEQAETLLCLVNCAAGLKDIPSDIEEALLERLIQAFTWVTY
uniref:Protein tyrosine phosphatase domain-containing protein 1 n=1 Tax=Latimeria chalumnae TaxID=7897 RepID=H3BAB8_LATCH